MPTIGDTAKPNLDHTESWSNTYNQAAQLLTMPERGRITALGGWFAGVNQSTLAKLCVWDDNGVLLGQTQQFTVSGRPWAAGNVDRYEGTLLVAVDLAAGASFYAGFSRDPAKSHQLTGRSTGGQHFDNKRATWPGTMEPNDNGSHGFGNYSIGMYVANYDAVGRAWVHRSGAWVPAERVAVYRSGAWVDAETVAARRGAAWVDAD